MLSPTTIPQTKTLLLPASERTAQVAHESWVTLSQAHQEGYDRPDTLRRCIKRGELHAEKHGNQWKVKLSDLRAPVVEHPTPRKESRDSDALTDAVVERALAATPPLPEGTRLYIVAVLGGGGRHHE